MSLEKKIQRMADFEKIGSVKINSAQFNSAVIISFYRTIFKMDSNAGL